MSDLFRVNAVVLVLAAVDQVQIERVSQDEGDLSLLAGIGQSVPT